MCMHIVALLAAQDRLPRSHSRVREFLERVSCEEYIREKKKKQLRHL